MKPPLSTNKQRLQEESLRRQAFSYFDLGRRPATVARLLGIKFSTTSRYYQQWKKLPYLFESRYRYARDCYRKLGQRDRGLIAGILADELGTTKQVVLARMQKPWGLKQMVSGQWRQWIKPGKKSGHFTKVGVQLRKVSLWVAPVEVKHIIELTLNPDIGKSDQIFTDE